MQEGIDVAIDAAKDMLTQLKQRMSALRKKGLDMKIPELRIMSVPSKIKMVEITRTYRDVQRVTDMLNNAKADIDEVETGYIEKKSGHGGKSEIDNIIETIDKIEQALENHDIREAIQHYDKCRYLYKFIPHENKKEVFNKMNEIILKIKQA